MTLLSAAVNLNLAQLSLLQRLKTSYLLSSLPCFPRPPAGCTSCQPPCPTTTPPTTQCPARYPQWTEYGHPWNYACRDYEACISACSLRPYEEPFHANAGQNLDAPYYEASGFVNLAPGSTSQLSVSNYYDCSDATALFPDPQHMFPTVSQGLSAPDYATNSLGPAPNGASLPAKKYSKNVPPMAAYSNLESLDAAASLPATAHTMLLIKVIA